MKRAIGYLSLALAVFLFSLLMLYIGFRSPAKNGADSPFIRMTVCTLMCIIAISFFTRYIHPVTGLAGLDSAWLNLGFTAAILLAVFAEFVTFGSSPVEPYMETLAEKVGVSKSTIAKWENGYVDNMRQNRVAKLAEIFGVSPTYIMGYDESDRNIGETITSNDVALVATKGEFNFRHPSLPELLKPKHDEVLNDDDKEILDMVRQLPQDKKELTRNMIKAFLQNPCSVVLRTS